MPDDEIIEELRKVKRDLAKKYNYDVRALCEALRQEQERSGHTTVSYPPKKLRGKTAAA